jgi:hypothetical protein
MAVGIGDGGAAMGNAGHRVSEGLHPRHGVQDPVVGTPPRAPGSVRRTSSIDMLRPEGREGPVVLHGRGRDLVTRADGTAAVTGEAVVELRVAYLDGRRVEAVDAEPGVPGVGGLVGVSASSGFRARVDAALPGEREARSLAYLLLDDVPGAALISGYSLGAAEKPGVGFRPMEAAYLRAAEDQCAGWASGATIMLEVGRSGRPPVVTGPTAPALEVAADPAAWHAMDALPPHGMRRRRRLDVRRDGALWAVESHFRDSHVSAEGRETVIHEYEVRARIEPGTWQVREARAVPRVLPWLECPVAADSAARLVGRSLRDIRREVRVDFRGTSTCTHLNDQLRSLADVVALAGSPV